MLFALKLYYFPTKPYNVPIQTAEHQTSRKVLEFNLKVLLFGILFLWNLGQSVAKKENVRIKAEVKYKYPLYYEILFMYMLFIALNWSKM